MNSHAEKILETALSLTASERAELAASLIASLDSEQDLDIDQAWADEIKRRIASIDNGQVELIPWDEVMGSMQKNSLTR